MDEWITQEIALLVQDYKRNILPFGQEQDDTAYLNEKNIWENPHLMCFQKLRMPTLHNARRMESFANGLLFSYAAYEPPLWTQSDMYGTIAVIYPIQEG